MKLKFKIADDHLKKPVNWTTVSEPLLIFFLYTFCVFAPQIFNEKTFKNTTRPGNLKLLF